LSGKQDQINCELIGFASKNVFLNLSFVVKKKYKIYHISCGQCQTYILTYHKYGAGKGIIRLYFHRKVEPATLLKQIRSEENAPKHLLCSNCNTILGTSSIQKGKRVFRMRKSYFHRRLVK